MIQPCGACLPPNHHRHSWNCLEIHASLSLSLWGCVCARVLESEWLCFTPPSTFPSAPRSLSSGVWHQQGTAVPQLKICIAASCCQTRSIRANKNIHLSLLILFHPHSLSEVFITSPWGAHFYIVLWSRQVNEKTIAWSIDSADKWNHTWRSLWCQLAGPGTDGELLLRRSS